MIPKLILTAVFTFLSLIHIYWLLGGEWGLRGAIPQLENQKESLAIPKLGTLVVALVLAFFGCFYFTQTGIIKSFFSENFERTLNWIIPVLFIARSIGEFKYVGFFKKVKSTYFSKWDTKFHSPLCFAVGVLGIIINYTT